MAIELLDKRLLSVMDESEYLRLKTELDQTYEKICQKAPLELMDEVSQLLHLMQEVETELLDIKTAAASTDWAQGTMSTLG